MFITYLDDAGTIGDHGERHYVMAGICIFERQIFYLDEALDGVVRDTGLVESPKDLELHGAEMYVRRKVWRKFRTREESCRVIVNALHAARKAKDWRLFGVVVDKKRCPENENPAEYAFEQICSRVDLYLRRRERKGDRHSGLLVLDNSAREPRLQALATQFRHAGHRWGNLRHFVEVPLFVDSKATRLVQYADLVCYALWRKYEWDDPRFFDAVSDKFDSEDGVRHGLFYYPPVNGGDQAGKRPPAVRPD